MIIRLLYLAIPLCVFSQWQQPSSSSQSNPNNQFQAPQDNRRGVINQILTPYNNTNNNLPLEGGVTIQFQLRGYSNPLSALPNGYTCICPPGRTCNYLKTEPTCYFSFTFIISSPDQSVRHLATDFVTLDPSGQLPTNNGIAKRWDENYVVQLPSKPSAIDIFAHHLGAVFNQADGSPVTMDGLTHADTFVVPLNDVIPAVGGVLSMNQQTTYEGKLIGTRLSLSYSISCTGSLIGPDCDLSCTPSPVNNQVASCRSNATGFFSICDKQNGGQVGNCKNCPWGIRDNTYCQTENGDVLDPHTAGVVDPSFKTATIVLGVISIVLFLLLIIAIIMACIMRRRSQPTEKEMTTFGHNGGPANQPLLQTGFRTSTDAPTPLPRSTPPSLDARPLRSALRKPMLPPNSSNDTRDTSFSNEVPMRPSRSQVV